MDLQLLLGIFLKWLFLKCMFVNLIGNVICYGGGDVEVYSGMEDGEICVWVVDCGVGLIEIEMYDLFELFVWGDQSRIIIGFGLGLVIVKCIVDMYYGWVWLQNREGGGLEVIVMFLVMGDLVLSEFLMVYLC